VHKEIKENLIEVSRNSVGKRPSARQMPHDRQNTKKKQKPLHFDSKITVN